MKWMGIACVMLGVGCADLDVSPALTWPAAVPHPSTDGRLIIQAVRNGRPPDKGGTNPRKVGNVRAEAGIPYAVTTERDGELEEAMTRLVSDSATNAGLGVAQAGDPTATSIVSANMTELWCDGYFGYKANITLAIQILDPATKAVRSETSVHASGGGDGCKPAVQGALGNLYTELTKAFVNGPVRVAMVGSGAATVVAAPATVAPAVQAPPAPSGGCASDADCKMGRVCSAGRCQFRKT